MRLFRFLSIWLIVQMFEWVGFVCMDMDTWIVGVLMLALDGIPCGIWILHGFEGDELLKQE